MFQSGKLSLIRSPVFFFLLVRVTDTGFPSLSLFPPFFQKNKKPADRQRQTAVSLLHARGWRYQMKNTMRKMTAVMIIVLLSHVVHAAGTVIISPAFEDEPGLEKTRIATVELYREYERLLGNSVATVSGYLIPKDTEYLYIVTHGWISGSSGATGFLYENAEGETCLMRWDTYIRWLMDNVPNLKTVVINSCLAGSAVKEAEESGADFAVISSCSDEEKEYGIIGRPLQFAVSYTGGIVPAVTWVMGFTMHPQSYYPDEGGKHIPKSHGNS